MAVQYKEFRIGDVLHKIDVVKIPYRIGEMPKFPRHGYTLPAIACSSLNQGIACYVPEAGSTVLQNVISVAANGDGYAFWQPDKFTIIQDAYAVERADGEALTENVALFLVAGLQKLLDQSFGWTNKSGWNKVKECSLFLPVTPSGMPDWDYMQERIAELEQERIAELEQYLTATGLNDFKLTNEDNAVLLEKKQVRNFRMNALFSSENGNVDLQQKDINGKGVALVSSGEANTGVIGFTNIPAKIFPKNTITVDMFGSAKYRDFCYKMVTHARVFSLFPKFDMNTENGIFINTVIGKSTAHFSYNNMCSWKKIQNNHITLPIQTDTSNNPVIDPDKTYHPDGYIPDWDYMSRYIRAMEKLVIQDVVKYKDVMIQKTKQIVEPQEAENSNEN